MEWTMQRNCFLPRITDDPETHPSGSAEHLTLFLYHSLSTSPHLHRQLTERERARERISGVLETELHFLLQCEKNKKKHLSWKKKSNLSNAKIPHFCKLTEWKILSIILGEGHDEQYVSPTHTLSIQHTKYVQTLTCQLFFVAVCLLLWFFVHYVCNVYAWM